MGAVKIHLMWINIILIRFRILDPRSDPDPEVRNYRKISIFSSWIRIHIRNKDPDPAGQNNANPYYSIISGYSGL